MPDNQTTLSLDFYPLTSERWTDFEELFGERGAMGGCWCMWWRISRHEFTEHKSEGNRKAMKAIVDSKTVPGILAYHQQKAVGWCSIAPRQQYGTLERSRVLKPLDDKQVWSLLCLFVGKGYRDKGVAQALITGAIDYVRNLGGKIIEAYPTISPKKRLPPVSSYIGTPKMFETAGFVECAQPSQSRMIMRYYVL